MVYLTTSQILNSVNATSATLNEQPDGSYSIIIHTSHSGVDYGVMSSDGRSKTYKTLGSVAGLLRQLGCSTFTVNLTQHLG